jgi:hypothetical protein
MTSRDMPPGIKALFSEAEIAEIEARPVQLSTKRSRDAIDLAAAWAHQVEKIGDERELAGSLLLRDFLQEALDGLRPPLRERLTDWVAGVDDRYRALTVDDPAGRMALVAAVDPTGRGWWWRRLPDTGPIAEDLARHDSNL